jgi:hypothetical protein
MRLARPADKRCIGRIKARRRAVGAVAEDGRVTLSVYTSERFVSGRLPTWVTPTFICEQRAEER